MRGQMFIITMVFLVGFIFAVQSNLSQYAFLDLADTFKSNDLPLLKGVKDSFRSTLESAANCEDAEKNLQELEAFLEDTIVEGTSIEIDQALDCSSGKELTLTIQLKSIRTDTRETLVITS